MIARFAADQDPLKDVFLIKLSNINVKVLTFL
jgi:hypothetical protein